MCEKQNDDSSKCNPIDVFLSDDFNVPNELNKVMEDTFAMKPIEEDKLNKMKETIFKRIDNKIDDDVDIEILNGWDYTGKTNTNPAMKKYILTVIAITTK